MLDLSGGDVATYVEFQQCTFGDSILVTDARASTLRFVNCTIPHFDGTRLHTIGDLHLPRSVISGGLVLRNARIGMDLLLNQARLQNWRQGCLAADGLTVGQDLMAEGMQASGEISLADAQIGSSLSFRGSRLMSRAGQALNAPRLSVDRSVYFSPSQGQETTVEGGLKLDDARCGRAVDLEGVRLNLRGESLSLRGMQASELRFTPAEVSGGEVVLAEAVVNTLVDQAESWPENNLDLSGFTYRRLLPSRVFSIEQRLQWLAAATSEYDPQPYEQLATCLRASGEPHDADTVLLNRMRRRRETLSRAARAWDVLQDVTFGYGYRPARAAGWLILFWLAGSVWFSLRPPAPMKAGEGPTWSAPVFTLDLLLPILDLGQENQWRTAGVSLWLTVVLSFVGWVLATSVAVGAAAVLLRRN
ncbi:oxidoreductase [Actinacidiphila glaucinigra]|uniref:oxidoreductase n=1 Tax=Actinacidiphila glaucinigra TaxID=235986 RepID=UPI002AFF24FA|nr:oxidoreductase [Actinacidiphila glaucinigra]